jgi:hypothetical protein
MANTAPAPSPKLPPGFLLAPIHPADAHTPLRICVLARNQPDAAGGAFLLLREQPGARVYLGAEADAEGSVRDWLEIWVQTLQYKDLSFSNYQERLSNHAFDQRWRSEYELAKASFPADVIVTGAELKNPRPVLIKKTTGQNAGPFAPTEPSIWQLCNDDALLESFGLPAYSTSPFRYLFQPGGADAKIFLATSEDALTNPHVQSIDRLRSSPETREVFNAHAGLLRVTRFFPLDLDAHLRLLEGEAWQASAPGVPRLLTSGIYSELQTWSAAPKGMPFLLNGRTGGRLGDRLNEIFFLKLSILHELFKEVRRNVKTLQLPLLNLSPASFVVSLANAGDQFPALWTARGKLIKPGQGYPLQMKSTEQKYFIRLGQAEPSIFLPETLGAHSFGLGSVRLRNIVPEADGLVLEGTLVAEDYLRLDPHDLLWFKLPLAEERLEFYAHVYTAEAVGPKEARFRTVPARLAESTVATLKKSLINFAKAPYEIWPLLSSPCDLYSLGILGLRILLANHGSNLPVIVDDFQGLARNIGKEASDEPLAERLENFLQKEKALLDLVSPHSLTDLGLNPEQARSQIAWPIWLETIALLLRLFPGAGTHSFCKGFGDVSPLALETVFDQPLQELETLVLRLRSVVTPTLFDNREITAAIMEVLGGL